MEITRADVREFIKYCCYCQNTNQRDKFDVTHSSIDNPLLNMIFATICDNYVVPNYTPESVQYEQFTNNVNSLTIMYHPIKLEDKPG